MARYSCFLLDASGVIRGAELIGATSDAEAWHEAIELLKARPAFCDVEVWESSRGIERDDAAAPDGNGSVGHHGLSETTFRRLHRPDDLRRSIPAENRAAAEAGPRPTPNRTNQDPVKD